MQGLGLKMKELRKKKQMTREALCGDESELSVRQLARIESGQSNPSLAKSLFIAKKLGVPLSDFVNPKELDLPKRYQELKYLILRHPTYMNTDSIEERESQFDIIFEDYYADLPEEEQVLIDRLQSRFEVYQSGNSVYGQDLLLEYIDQIKKKKTYDLNDIFFIDLYLTCGYVSSFKETLFDKGIFECFTSKLILLEEKLDFKDLFLLNNVLMTAIAVGLTIEEYVKIRTILNVCRRIMTITQDFQRMPIYYMYEWRYTLFHEKDFRKAPYYYQQSLLFARTHGDEYLKTMIVNAWQEDQDKVKTLESQKEI